MHWGVINKEKPIEKAPNQSEEQSDKKGLTPNQKKALIIGASVVVTGLAIYGGYKLHQSGKLGKLSELGKKKLEASFDEKTGFQKIPNWDKIKGAELRHSVGAEEVNPGRMNIFNYGRQYNCGNCAIANELRQRGLDVTARPNKSGMRLEAMGEFFNGLNNDSFLSLHPDEGMTSAGIASANPAHAMARGKAIKDNIAAEMLKHYPDGARGTMFIPMDNSNHFTSWFVDKGSVHFIDAQHPEINNDHIFGTINSRTAVGKLYDGVKAIRLDNLEVNNDTIRKVVVSRVVDMKDHASEIYDVNLIQGVGFTLRE